MTQLIVNTLTAGILALGLITHRACANDRAPCKDCPNPAAAFEVKVAKKVNLDFKCVAEIDVNIASKYGTVTLLPWAKDSVKMEVEITARGQTKAEAERIMERVELRYTHGPTALNVDTDIRQQEVAGSSVSGTVQGLWNSLVSPLTNTGKPTTSATNNSGPANTTIDQHNLQVHLKIRVPFNAVVDIDNKYGDVLLNGPIKGRLDLDMDYGDLRADYPIAAGRISIKNGKANIKLLQSGSVEARYGSIHLSNGGDVLFLTNNAEVDIDSVTTLTLDTRYGNVQVHRPGNVSGKTYLTQLTLHSLARGGDLEMQFGDLAVKSLKTSVPSLAIRANRTAIMIELGSLTDYQLELTGKNGQVEYPAKLTKVENGKAHDWANNSTIKGTMGSGKKIFKIESRDGVVVVK